VHLLFPVQRLAWPLSPDPGCAAPTQCVQAAQITFEDHFLSNMDVAPLMLVGYEGVFGTIFMLGIMLPLVQHLPGVEGQGIHENTLDTLHVGSHRALRSAPSLHTHSPRISLPHHAFHLFARHSTPGLHLLHTSPRGGRGLHWKP
jgi:hypothetical protein